MVEKSKPENLQIRGSGFIIENTGNIKDYYKISSCIGRGMYLGVPLKFLWKVRQLTVFV